MKQALNLLPILLQKLCGVTFVSQIIDDFCVFIINMIIAIEIFRTEKTETSMKRNFPKGKML